MAREGFRVQEMRSLQFWRKWIVTVVWCCYPFVFDASADSQEQVEDRLHCITRSSSDGVTASSSDGEWEEISSALDAEPCAPRELQISNNIDPTGEFKVKLGLADEASQPTDAAVVGPSAQCQIPPPRGSLEGSKESDIITAQRTPKPAVQDVKIGKEVLVVNTRYVNIKPDQIQFLNQDHICFGEESVDAYYEDLFREFGKPELDNAAVSGRSVEAKPFKGPGHVPPSVSEGSVSTFAMHVDKTKTILVPSMEKRRTAAGKGAEVHANLEQTPPTQKNLQMENDSSDSLGQGSSSSSLMQ